MAGDIEEHDNSEFNDQEKENNLLKVMERFNVPRPIKLEYNADAVQKVINQYDAAGNKLENNYLLPLIVYNSKQDNALTPFAYYMIYPKVKRSLDEKQVNKILSLLSPEMQLAILAKVGLMDPIISTLKGEVIDRINVLVNEKNETTAQEVQKMLLEHLPIAIKRDALAFIPEKNKEELTAKLLTAEYGLSFLNRYQKDHLLAELLVSEFPQSPDTPQTEKITDHNLLFALKKYTPESRDSRLAAMKPEVLAEGLKNLFNNQLVEMKPNMMMLFMDGDAKDLRKYSKMIESVADANQDQVEAVVNEPGFKNFFEKIVSLNVNTTTHICTLSPGVQSEIVIPLPTAYYKNGQTIGPRMVCVRGNPAYDPNDPKSSQTKTIDIGDRDNTFSSSNDPHNPGQYVIDCNVSDVRAVIHAVAHGMKLRHNDDMFLTPKQIKLRNEMATNIQIEGLQLKPVEKVQDNPSLTIDKASMTQALGGKNVGIAASAA